MYAAKVFALAAPLFGLAIAIPTTRALDWGHWTLTDIKGTEDPSNTYIEFNLTDTNIPGTVPCYATLDRAVGPENTYFSCPSNDAVKFTTSTDLKTIYVSRKLYQTQSIVLLNGTASLDITETNTQAGTDFTAADVTVPINQTGVITG